MMPGYPYEQLMRENRSVNDDRHIWIMPPTSKNTSPAIRHQRVRKSTAVVRNSTVC